MCRGLPNDLVADALLLTTELVTNAAKFTASIITVAVECDEAAIAVAVADDSQEELVLGEPATDATGGRGLRLVDGIARAWGWAPRPDAAGKIVWFRVGPPSSVDA